MTPDQLVEERRRTEKPEDKLVRRWTEERLDKWFARLIENTSSGTGEKLKRGTCVLAHSAIKRFYKHNYYELKTDPPAS